MAFLVGYSSFTGNPPSLSVVPPEGAASYSHFERIARAFAVDTGVSAELLRKSGWREQVADALVKHFGPPRSHQTVEELFGPAAQYDTELAAAYLAGAYSRHGTSTGFRLVNQRKGLYLAWLIRSVFVDLSVEVTLKPGVPGNITITIRDGGQQTVQGFIEELERVRSIISDRK